METELSNKNSFHFDTLKLYIHAFKQKEVTNLDMIKV